MIQREAPSGILAGIFFFALIFKQMTQIIPSLQRSPSTPLDSAKSNLPGVISLGLSRAREERPFISFRCSLIMLKGKYFLIARGPSLDLLSSSSVPVAPPSDNTCILRVLLATNRLEFSQVEGNRSRPPKALEAKSGMGTQGKME